MSLARSWPHVKHSYVGRGYAFRRALWFSNIPIFGTSFKLLFCLFLLSFFSFTSSIVLPPSPSFLAFLLKYDSPPSHTYFFVYALMVDYSKITYIFPSVSFFFSRLGAFLEPSSGHCPRVRLFASQDSALRLVLIELYLGLSK